MDVEADWDLKRYGALLAELALETLVLADLLRTSIEQEQSRYATWTHMGSSSDSAADIVAALADLRRGGFEQNALRYALLESMRRINNFFYPQRDRRQLAKRRSAWLRQQVPASVLDIYGDGELGKDSRNDYAHIDERLDDGEDWIERGGPLRWTLTRGDQEAVEVDLVPFLLATDDVYRAFRDGGKDPFPIPWSAEWLPQEDSPAGS